jgi:hypothetical protein
LRQVERTAAARLHLAGHLDAAGAGARDGARGGGGVEQGGLRDVVGIGEGGLVAGHGAHADALVDREAAALDDALFQAPAFALGELEIQVGVVDLVREHRPERGDQLAFVEAERRQQDVARDREGGKIRFEWSHCVRYVW